MKEVTSPRRPDHPDHPDRPYHPDRPDSPERAALVDEAAFLRLSLEDLDRELAAGELGRADYEELRARYEERAAAVAESLRRVDAAGRRPVPPGQQQPRRRFRRATRRHRVVLGWAAAACFAAAGLLVGLGLAGVAPFTRASAPLSAQSRIDIELAEAGVLAGHNQVSLAIQTYAKVLAIDPEQPEALTDGGWLLRLAGLSSSRPSLVANGDREIVAAAALDPRYALAHAYEGVVLLEDRRDAPAAASSFKIMLADHPTAALVSSVRAEAVTAFADAHEALPTAFGN